MQRATSRRILPGNFAIDGVEGPSDIVIGERGASVTRSGRGEGLERGAVLLALVLRSRSETRTVKFAELLIGPHAQEIVRLGQLTEVGSQREASPSRRSRRRTIAILNS